MNITPVILAGGAGTRLWPMSIEERPKQFLKLPGGQSLFEETINRLSPLEPKNYIVVTSDKYEKITKESLAKFTDNGIVLPEPEAKNTATAILYAALYLQKVFEDSVMIILPADHYVKDIKAFNTTINLAIDEARKGNIATIGIKPTFPETGYGYIKSGESINQNVLKAVHFTEKPEYSLAKEYLKKGNYFWNSGIFVWQTSTIINAFKKLMPELFQKFEPFEKLSLEEYQKDEAQTSNILKSIFQKTEPVSIDYGILEKSDNIVIIPAQFDWADLGSWKSVDDIIEADSDINRTTKPEKTIFVKANNCTVFSEKKRVSIVGLNDVTVVESGDEILVIHKEHSQDVKQVVELTKNK